MHPIYEKYRAVTPLNDEQVTNAILGQMVKAPKADLADFYARDPRVGQFYLVRDSDHKGKVLEYVPDMIADTSVTTLYAEHPIFATRQALIDARKEIIEAIERTLLAMPGTPTVRDEGRGKEFHLFELGTAQLLDVLNHFTK